MNNSLYEMIEPECTLLCKSESHSHQLMAAISGRPLTDRLQTYCRYVCHNFPLITDIYGRNTLHLGASCGDSQFVRWLIEKCHSEVDSKDLESGWTALHRSIFYGEIGCAKTLIDLGADLNILDHNFCTPLDLLMFDRPPYIEYNRSDLCDCYVWGSNVNFNLGVESEQSRKTPEIVTTFKREGLHIKEVIIRKFHSLFLTNDGKVLTCGHGMGGRLAQDSEDLSIKPKFISGLNELSCVEAMASGQDHIILLVRNRDKSVNVYSCGLNTYHVLGQSPPPEKLLTPKLICLKSLKLGSNPKLNEIIGVGAARYHSLFYTKYELFTFGLNVGQIGHSFGERTYIIPQRVSAVNFKDTDTYFEHIVTSDGAIVCSTNKGDVFVLHEYQCRKVASVQIDIKQICVVGGYLYERTDVAGIHDNSRVELKIILLKKSGDIFVWKGTDPSLVQCLIGFGRQLSVTHICLNITTVGIVTNNGEVFFGSVSNRKKKDLEHKKTETNSGVNQKSNIPSKTDKTNQKSIALKGSAQMVRSFVKFINKDECHVIHVKKQSNIQRGVAVFCDDQNRNFAVLQSSAKNGVLETPDKPNSQMNADMKTFFETIDSNDKIHDLVIKVGNRQYLSHKFILLNRSEYFRKKLSLDPECDSITLDFINCFEAFEQILKFIYFNSNDLFENSKKLNWISLKTDRKNSTNVSKKRDQNKTKDKSKNDSLNEVKEISKKLGINWLTKWLSDGLQIIGNKVKIMDYPFPPKLVFDRNKHEFYDIIIKSEDNIEFKCHKCLLISRLEYFRGMLSSGWIETSTNRPLMLPMSSKILDILMDYIYCDQFSNLEAIDDPEFICKVLVVADQYLIPVLKTYCEYVLVNLLNLKNACELLELSYIYRAQQLRRCCLDFICINLLTLIESKSLNVLSEESIKDLTQCYQNMVTRPHNRRIYRYSDSPKSEEFERIFSLFDSKEEFFVNIEERKAIIKQKMKIKRSNRYRNESTSSDTNEDLHLSKLSLSPPKDISELNKCLESVKQNKTVLKDLRESPLNSELSVKPKPIKWGLNSTTIPPPISLKEIISAEEREYTKITKTKPINNNNNNNTITINSNKNESFRQNPIAITRKVDRNNRNNSFKTATIDSNISKSFAEMAVSPPKLSSNPWKKFESCSPNSPSNSSSFLNNFPEIETSLKEIVRTEEEKLQNLRALQTKPLHIISIEDKAIEELLKFYSAENNPNEFIRVERVVSTVAEPIWSRIQ